MLKNKSTLYFLLILASSLFFFVPFLGKVHLFDWDEINFAESAREMIVTGDYSRVMINFQPFWEKPPLFFWLQAMSMHLFGINEFAARFPNAVFGVISLLTLYIIGKKTVDERFGLIWALSYLGSFLPHLYFKSGIIDPVFNYFIFMGVYFMYRAASPTPPKEGLSNPDSLEEGIERRKLPPLGSGAASLLSGIFIGLANLTKGPVGLLIFLLTAGIFWATLRFRKVTSIRNIFVFILSFSVISFFWFGAEVIEHGFWFLKEFFIYQVKLFTTPVAGHQEPIYYHFIVVLLGCFPISIFALPVLLNRKSDEGNEFILKENDFPKKSQSGSKQQQEAGLHSATAPAYSIIRKSGVFEYTGLMRILFWTVLILFTIVTTKIVHYSSLTYFPLSFLASIYIYRLVSRKAHLAGYVFWFFIVISSVFSILLIGLPLVAAHKELIIPYIKDPFAVANLQIDVKWSGFEFLIGLIYWALIVTLIIRFKTAATLNKIIALFYTTALCLFFYLISVVPKIEAYSQAPAINFYKSMAGKDVDAISVGFYSYAKFFYFQKPIPSKKYDTELQEEAALLNGKITRPAYFIVKITNTDFPKAHPDCKLIKQEGGFLFYERLPG